MNDTNVNNSERRHSRRIIELLDFTEVEQECVECNNPTKSIFKIKRIPLCEQCYERLKMTKYFTIIKLEAIKRFNITDDSILKTIYSVKVPHPVKDDWHLRLFLLEDVKKLQLTQSDKDYVVLIKCFKLKPISNDLKGRIERQVFAMINNNKTEK